MARKSGIGFWRSKGGYYCWHRFEQHCLFKCQEDDRPNGPNYLKAMDAFAKLMREPVYGIGYDGTFGAVLNLLITHLANGPQKNTARQTRTLLQPMADAIGHVKMRELTAKHVRNWIDAQTTWGATTRYLAWHRAKVALSEALQRGDIAVHPLAGIKTPPTYVLRSRGAECHLPDDLVRAIILSAKGPFRTILYALWKTGARPGELINAERKHYRGGDKPHLFFSGDPLESGFRHKTAKTKKKGDRNRRIYLNGELDAMVRAQMKRTNVLFPNGDHKWDHGSLQARMRRVRTRPVVAEWLEANPHEPKRFILYSWRHTYITNAIKRGVHLKVLADLCGTSAHMIECHYSHVVSDTDAMYEAYLRTVDDDNDQ